MYPRPRIISGVADRRWIWTRKASQGGRTCKQFLAILQVSWHCLAEEKNASISQIDLQDMLVKNFIHIALARK